MLGGEFTKGIDTIQLTQSTLSLNLLLFLSENVLCLQNDLTLPNLFLLLVVVLRLTCWRGASRQKTSWSQRGRLSWQRSWDFSPDRLQFGSRTGEPGGRQSSSRGTMIFSNHHTTPSLLTTTTSPKRMRSSGLR